MKRKIASTGKSNNKAVKTESQITRFIGESHDDFYPAGAVIQLCLLSFRNSSSDRFELFGIDPLFRLILDYLGSYRPFIVVWHGENEDGRHIVSAHPTEILAVRAAFVEFCDYQVSSWTDILEEGGSSNVFSTLDSFMSRILSSGPDIVKGDAVRTLIASYYEDGTLSDDSVNALWKLCVVWQTDEGRQFHVEGLTFDSDVPETSESDTEIFGKPSAS
jgi:hypothetical protein